MKWDRVNRRRAIVWGAWGLVLIAGLSGLLLWHTHRSWNEALRRFTASVGSPEYRDYLAAPVPERENAATAFVAASAGLDMGREWTRSPRPDAWTEETGVQARELIAGHRPALGGLTAAAALPRCVWPEATEVDMQRMLALLRAGRLLRIEGFVAVADRDPTRIERAFWALGRLAECLDAAPHLVGSQIAVSIERGRLELVHAVVSSPDATASLVDVLYGELERMARVDRVARAVAVEGALALDLLATRTPEGLVRRFLFETFLLKRTSAALASRWIEFAAWSRLPFEDLRGQPAPGQGGDRSVSGMVADLATANLRYAILEMRANRELIELARLVTEIRLHGLRRGDYAGALALRSELGILEQGDGSVVLIDRELEQLLSDRLAEADANPDSSLASMLELTVWRLPAPDRRP